MKSAREAKSGPAPTTIDEYIAASPEAMRGVLEEVRSVIRTAVPDAEEAISYGMPTFRLHGNLVHFAIWKNHLGFYPGPGGIDSAGEAGARYRSAKGTMQFPLDEPIPYGMIRLITTFRAEENVARWERKKK